MSRAALASAFAGLLGLLGCESVLGIEEPMLERDAAVTDAASDPVDAAVDAPTDVSAGDAVSEDVQSEPPPNGCTIEPIVTCTAQRTDECGAYGCLCVDGNCQGGYCDPAQGVACSQQEIALCLGCGCACAEHQCSGGECPGDGCTIRARDNCAAFGCGCLYMKCDC